VMWASFHDLVTTEPARGRPLLAGRYPYYVLVESLGGDPKGDAERFEAVLGEALEEGAIADAVIAKSRAEREALWALRDDVAQTARHWPIVAFDVSLPITAMEDYVARVTADLAARWPQRPAPVVFGHLGDGNLHVIVATPDPEPATRHAAEEIVYAPLEAVNGSISAEHGVGLQKRDFLHLSRSPEELAAMRRLKAAFDPANILNPGKIFV